MGAAPTSGTPLSDTFIILDSGTLNFRRTPDASIGATRGISIGRVTGSASASDVGTISVASGASATILGAIKQNTGVGVAGATLNVVGPGTLTLSSTSSNYAGGTIVSGTGQLNVASDDRLGLAPATLTANALVLDNGTLYFNATSATLGTNRGIQVGPTTGSGSGALALISGLTLNYGGIIANNASGTGSLIVSGTPGAATGGVLALTASNTYTGPTNPAIGGTLQLNFAASVLTSNILNPLSMLAPSGGTLTLTGTATPTSQTFSSLGNSGFGAAVVNVNPGSGTTADVYLTANGGTRTVGGTVMFNLPSTPTTIPAIGSSIILDSSGGAFATVGLTNFAARDVSTGAVISGASVPGFYTINTSTTLAGNADNTGSGTNTTLVADTAVSSLRFNDIAARTVTSTGFTLTTGGILVTPNVGANASVITGGSLVAPSAGRDLIVIQNNPNPLGSLTINSVIADNTSASSLTKAGAGSLILAAANTFTGPINVLSGVLQIGTGNTDTTSAIPLAATTTVGPGATLVWARGEASTPGSIYSGLINGLGNLTVQSGFLTLTGGNGLRGTVTIDTGASLSLGNGGTSGNMDAAIGIVNNGSLIFNRSSPVTAVPGSISGSGTVTKLGSGNWSMSSNSTYSGVTLVSAGSLYNGGNNAFSPNSDVQVASGAVLGMNGFSGTIKSLADSPLNGAGSVSNVGASTGNPTLTINGPLGTDTTFSGTILNNTLILSLAKSGESTQTLSGVLSYTGATTVNAGVLNINGTASTATGTVSVSGGTLGGTGTVGGGVSVATGATIRGGTGGVGTLTLGGPVANTLTFASGSRLAIAITDATTGGFANTGASTSGLIPNQTNNSVLRKNSTGLTTLSTGMLVVIDASSVTNFVNGGTYSYLVATGLGDQSAFSGTNAVVTQSQFGFTNPNYVASNFSLSSNGTNDGNLYLNFTTTPVPEPGTILGLGALGLGAIRWVRRRRIATSA